jgi:hypothetical protein
VDEIVISVRYLAKFGVMTSLKHVYNITTWVCLYIEKTYTTLWRNLVIYWKFMTLWRHTNLCCLCQKRETEMAPSKERFLFTMQVFTLRPTVSPIKIQINNKTIIKAEVCLTHDEARTSCIQLCTLYFI